MAERSSTRDGDATPSCLHAAMLRAVSCGSARSAPLRIALYHTDDLSPSFTLPMTEAVGATKTSSPSCGFAPSYARTGLCRDTVQQHIGCQSASCAWRVGRLGKPASRWGVLDPDARSFLTAYWPCSDTPIESSAWPVRRTRPPSVFQTDISAAASAQAPVPTPAPGPRRNSHEGNAHHRPAARRNRCANKLVGSQWIVVGNVYWARGKIASHSGATVLRL